MRRKRRKRRVDAEGQDVPQRDSTGTGRQVSVGGAREGGGACDEEEQVAGGA